MGKIGLVLPILIAVNALAAKRPSLPTNTREQQSSIEKRVAVDHQDIVQRIQKTLRALRTLDKKIAKSTSKVVKTDSELVRLQNNIEEINTSEQQTLEVLDAKKALLAKRMRALHQLSAVSLPSLISQAKSAQGLENSLRILKQITFQDLALIKSYSTEKKKLAEQRKNLNKRQSDLAALSASLKVEEQQFTKEQEQKEKLLKGLQKLSKREETKKILQASPELSLSIDEFQRLAKSATFMQLKGRLLPPLPGYIHESLLTADSRTLQKKSSDQSHDGFNSEAQILEFRKSPLLQGMPGLFFWPTQVSRVRSVFSGTIKYVGITPGFGNTIIVDHRDNFSTIYAGLKGTSKHIGDAVGTGEDLGETDLNPLFMAPLLYFEIRHFEKPVQVTSWISKETS